MHGQAFLVPIGVAFHFDLLEFSWCVTACVGETASCLSWCYSHTCARRGMNVVCRWAAAGTMLSTSSLVRFTVSSALRRPSTCALDAVVFLPRQPLYLCNAVLCCVAALHGPVLCAASCFSDSYAITERLAASWLVAQPALTQNQAGVNLFYLRRPHLHPGHRVQLQHGLHCGAQPAPQRRAQPHPCRGVLHALQHLLARLLGRSAARCRGVQHSVIKAQVAVLEMCKEVFQLARLLYWRGRLFWACARTAAAGASYVGAARAFG